MKFYINSTISTEFGSIGRGWHESQMIADKYNIKEAEVETLVGSLVSTEMAILEKDKLQEQEAAKIAEDKAQRKIAADQKKAADKNKTKEAPKGAKVDDTKTATAGDGPDTKTATTGAKTA